MPLKKSVDCGFPLSGDSACTKKTKNENGRCHLHVGMSAVGDPSAVAAAQAESTAASAAQSFDGEDVQHAVMWISPDGPEKGAPMGEAVMIADGDVTDSAVVTQRYVHSTDPDSHYDVLHLTLTPEGEQKMLDALGVQQTKTELVTHNVEEMGAHTLDTEHGLHSKVTQIAKSVNARRKSGESMDEIRQTNQSRLDLLETEFATASAKADPSDEAAQAMLAHYQNHIDRLGAELAKNEYGAYVVGEGKIELLDDWQGTFTKQVSEEVEVGVTAIDAASVPTTEVIGKRLKPVVKDGVSRWGTQMWSASKAPEKMWKMDLGDGYTAVYYPDEIAAKSAYSLKRRMHVISPKNGSAHEALNKLKKLHINSDPMTSAQSEFTYLERNAHAMGLLEHPTVQQARMNASKISHTYARVRLHDRQDELAGIPEHQQEEWVHRQLVAAEADALPKKARVLREAVAKASGFADGDELTKHKSYDPIPKRSQGSVYFNRFAKGPTGATALPDDTYFSCTITGNGDNVVEVARNGMAMASQERRWMVGTDKNFGMSESQDVQSGGASAVFLHIGSGKAKKHAGGTPTIVWDGDQAQALARRTDWWATSGDHYGATNEKDHHHHSKPRRTIEEISQFAGGQMMMEGSIGMVSHAPTAILCSSPGQRTQVVKAFADQGITKFPDGRTVEDVVKG